MKNVVFPPMPFYVVSYNFSKVKSALEFVKELEIFHFGENSFHINDSQGKVATHRALLKVNFEYVDHFDEDIEVHQNACKMNSLNKHLRRNIIVLGGKGSSRSNPEKKGQDEEDA